jgi:hypothetical protein
VLLQTSCPSMYKIYYTINGFDSLIRMLTAFIDKDVGCINTLFWMLWFVFLFLVLVLSWNLSLRDWSWLVVARIEFQGGWDNLALFPCKITTWLVTRTLTPMQTNTTECDVQTRSVIYRKVKWIDYQTLGVTEFHWLRWWRQEKYLFVRDAFF